MADILKCTQYDLLLAKPKIGQMYFVVDTRALYKDNGNNIEQRIRFNAVILNTESERVNSIRPIVGKFYYVEETNALWLFDTRWVLKIGQQTEYNTYYAGEYISPIINIDESITGINGDKIIDNNGLLGNGSVVIRDTNRIMRGLLVSDTNYKTTSIKSYLDDGLLFIPNAHLPYTDLSTSLGALHLTVDKFEANDNLNLIGNAHYYGNWNNYGNMYVIKKDTENPTLVDSIPYNDLEIIKFYIKSIKENTNGIKVTTHFVIRPISNSSAIVHLLSIADENSQSVVKNDMGELLFVGGGDLIEDTTFECTRRILTNDTERISEYILDKYSASITLIQNKDNLIISAIIPNIWSDSETLMCDADKWIKNNVLTEDILKDISIDVNNKEDITNKVSLVEDPLSETQYPSIKAMTNYVDSHSSKDNIVDVLVNNVSVVDDDKVARIIIANKDIDYLTPEMFGAKGDGIAFDNDAITEMIKYGKTHNIKRFEFGTGKTYLLYAHSLIANKYDENKSYTSGTYVYLIDELATTNVIKHYKCINDANIGESPINTLDKWQFVGPLEDYFNNRIYNIGDLVSIKTLINNEEIMKHYRCIENNVTGEFNTNKWEEISNFSSILTQLGKGNIHGENFSAIITIDYDDVMINLNNSKLKMYRSCFPVGNFISIVGNNCVIKNGEILGDKNEYTYSNYKHTLSWFHSTYEQVIGVCTRGNNVRLENVDIHDFCGDAITAGKLENFTSSLLVNECSLHDCRRQGISILESGDFTLKNSHIYNIGLNEEYVDGGKTIYGTSPRSGIDIEPDGNGSRKIGNFTIENSIIEFCKGFTIILGTDNALADSNVRIHNSVFDGPLQIGMDVIRSDKMDMPSHENKPLIYSDEILFTDNKHLSLKTDAEGQWGETNILNKYIRLDDEIYLVNSKDANIVQKIMIADKDKLDIQNCKFTLTDDSIEPYSPNYNIKGNIQNCEFIITRQSTSFSISSIYKNCSFKFRNTVTPSGIMYINTNAYLENCNFYNVKLYKTQNCIITEKYIVTPKFYNVDFQPGGHTPWNNAWSIDSWVFNDSSIYIGTPNVQRFTFNNCIFYNTQMGSESTGGQHHFIFNNCFIDQRGSGFFDQDYKDIRNSTLHIKTIKGLHYFSFANGTRFLNSNITFEDNDYTKTNILNDSYFKPDTYNSILLFDNLTQTMKEGLENKSYMHSSYVVDSSLQNINNTVD